MPTGDPETDRKVKKFIDSVKDGPGRVGNTVVDSMTAMGGAADKASKAPGKFRKAVKDKFGI